jgi:thioredoxin reductase (NADPH)
MTADRCEALIVGGEPGGRDGSDLSYRISPRVIVIDEGQSRAKWIPLSHNHAGSPEGIGTQDLLRSMREQAEQYGATI